VAQPLSINVEAPVTLGTTVSQLSGISGAKSLILWESDVDVYVVLSPSATDGGALPSTGRPLISTSVMPFEIDISPYGFVGVAAASAGTARVEARS
jgi:hypothetical protein